MSATVAVTSSSTTRRRVLALVEARSLSGPLRQTITLASELRSQGTELCIGLPTPVDTMVLDHATALGVGVVSFAWPDLGPPWRQVRTLLSRFGADLLQTHSYKPDILAALGRASVAVPWLMVHHGVTAENRIVRMYHGLDRQAARFANGIVCVADAQRRRFKGLGVPIWTIPNALLQPGAHGGVTALNESLDRGPVLWCIGRLSFEKGVDRAIGLLAELRGRGMWVRMGIVGDGPERKRLEMLVEQIGVRDAVTWYGHRDEPWAYVASHDVLLLPSRSEGMPNVLFEAVQCGVRYAAAGVGDVPIIHAAAPGAGVILDPEAGESTWANAVAALIAAPHAAATARRARESLANAFSPARRASRFSDVYDSLQGLR